MAASSKVHFFLRGFSIKLCLLITLGFALTLLSGCGQKDDSTDRSCLNKTDSRQRILATTAQIADLVHSIVQDKMLVDTLITGELDPHSYELVKGDDEKVYCADLIFFNGLNLEHGPSLKRFLSTSPKAIGLGDLIAQDDPTLLIYDDGQVDPHIWMDISLWQKAVPFIKNALIALDAQNQLFYEEQAAKLDNRMQEAHLAIYQNMQTIHADKRYLITSHDAFNYFARAYLREPSEVEFNEWKQRFMAPEGLAPEGQISVKDIQNIICHMKVHHIGVLFAESNVSQDSIKKIMDAAAKEGLKLQIASESLYGDAMGPISKPTGTYLGMMAWNAETIAKYIGKDESSH